VDDVIDLGCSIALVGCLALVLGSHAVASVAAGRILAAKRVEREQGLPVVGKAPMHAVYRALVPLARALVALRVSANAVTLISIVLAVCAAIAFGYGRLGVGAVVACASALADALDGMVARESGTASRAGRILDTTVDRYVDALLLGGLAVHVRADAALLVLVLAAIVGSFMVSYASSVERELGVTESPAVVPMRRAHRLAYLLTGATLGPLAAQVAGKGTPNGGLFPILVAAFAIAVLGNVSAIRRLAAVARAEPTAGPPAPAPDSHPTEVDHAAPPVSEGARR